MVGPKLEVGAKNRGTSSHWPSLAVLSWLPQRLWFGFQAGCCRGIGQSSTVIHSVSIFHWYINPSVILFGHSFAWERLTISELLEIWILGDCLVVSIVNCIMRSFGFCYCFMMAIIWWENRCAEALSQKVFSLRQYIACSILPVSLIQAHQEVIAIAHNYLWSWVKVIYRSST